MPETYPHPSFVFLSRVLASYSSAADSAYLRSDPVLDADGGWTGVYRLLAPRFAGALPKLDQEAPESQIGWVRLVSSRSDAGTELSLRKNMIHGATTLVTHATMVCAADRLSTLRSWTSETTIRGCEPPLRSTASLTIEQWRMREGASDQIRLASNWSLMDALQRGARSEMAQTEHFELLEDLELWKRGQRLDRIEPIDVELGGATSVLQGFAQIGRGTPPIHYWLTESGRLLFVIGSLWALAFDTEKSR